MSLFDIEDIFALRAQVPSDLLMDTTIKQTPFVTIAIPTYKRPTLVQEALQSAINQDGFDDFEIIVVDNDNTRDTETERAIISAKPEKVRYFKNRENLGATENWNRCIQLARGKWVTLLHDDDAYFPNYLHDLVVAIKENPKIEFIHARQFQWDDDHKESINSLFKKYGSLRKVRPRRVSPLEDYFGSPIKATGNIFIRENAIKLGGVKPSAIWPNSDTIFTSLYCYHYNCFYMDKFLGVYRWGNNATLNMDLIVKLATCNWIYKTDYGHLLKLPNWLIQFEAKYSTIFYANNLKMIYKLYPANVRSLLEHHSFGLFGLHCLCKLIKKKLFR